MLSSARPRSRAAQLGHLIFVRLLGLSLVLVLATVAATVAARQLVPPAPSPAHQWILLKNLLLPIVLVLLYGVAVRVLERRDPTEIAAGTGARLFPFWLVAGAAIVSLYVVALLALGDAHPVWAGTAPGGLGALNALLVPWLTAVGEELLFRLILFRLLEEALGTALAALVSAALFGLAHAGNPGANPESLAFLAFGFGILAALSYAATRNVWAPVGLHMGWNFAEGCLFGLANSGQEEPVRMVHTTLSGPALLTGGAFGPEGSLPLFALCLVAGAALVQVARRRGRWQSMRQSLHAT